MKLSIFCLSAEINIRKNSIVIKQIKKCIMPDIFNITANNKQCLFF